MILGDFNQEPEQLTQHHIWVRHGWRNAQQVAETLFHHQTMPTCKGADKREQIWLSPEAIQLLRGIQVFDHFVDHATVAIQLQVPHSDQVVHRWPRPAEIPWQDLDLDDWTPSCAQSWDASQDTTQFLHQWAHAFEDSITQHAAAQGKPLPKRCHGRASRLQPAQQAQATPTCRPSREGEASLTNSMAGKATRL